MRHQIQWILIVSLGVAGLDCDQEECRSSADCPPGQACNNGVCEGMDADTDTDTDADSDGDTDSDTDTLNCEGGRYDASTGLCWQHPRANKWYDWEATVRYCDELSLSGHDDWYLPSRQDFINLLGGCDSNVLEGEWGYCSPCDESQTCSQLFDDGIQYWSSTPAGPPDTDSDKEYAWSINFGSGYLAGGQTWWGADARCVRLVQQPSDI